MRGDETDDRQPGSQTTPRTPRGRGWTGMLGSTSRPTNPENEPNGIHQKLRESGLTGCNDPDPVALPD